MRLIGPMIGLDEWELQIVLIMEGMSQKYDYENEGFF